MSRPYRNRKIGEYIRSGEVACCITGSTYGVANHHLIGHGYSGMATKPADYLQMAIRHDLHADLHNYGWKEFEAKHGRSQKSMVAETMAKLHADGVVSLDDFDIPDWFVDELEKLAYE